MTLIEIAGAVGNFCFAVACGDLLYHTLKAGNADALKSRTIALFCAANAAFYTYLIGTYGFDVFYAPLGMVELGAWLAIACVKLRDFAISLMADGGELSEDWELEVCTRPTHAEGPCNGLPREDCPVYSGDDKTLETCVDKFNNIPRVPDGDGEIIGPFGHRAPFPHCDSDVLHAPGTCEFCDDYPGKQDFRLEQGVGFTNERDWACKRPLKRQCPSLDERPREVIERWEGNRPVRNTGVPVVSGVGRIGV